MEDRKPLPPSADPPIVHQPANPTVAPVGVPGFHNKVEEGDGVALAGMELDEDTDAGRVNTGTGDQPSNTEGSRFSTPAEGE